MNKNIVFDFTANQSVKSLTENIPLAVMPAELAKKLLRSYQKQLMRTSPEDIINEHIEDLRGADGIDNALEISINWILQRNLITNVRQENWGAYAVEPDVVGVVDVEDSRLYANH